MKPARHPNGEAATAKITKRIQGLGDWRGETLAHVRQLIRAAVAANSAAQAQPAARKK